MNSTAGSNCCTCNCQSTLQAILQELKTMRKLMHFQAGTQISPPHTSSAGDVSLPSPLVCIVLLSRTPPTLPSVLLCLFKYSFSLPFQQPAIFVFFFSFFFFKQIKHILLTAPNTAAGHTCVNSAYRIS